MNYHWPDPSGLIDEISEILREEDQELVLSSMDDFLAGLARAQSAAGYITADELGNQGDDLPYLAALMFEGVADRHPLMDGNKRLAFLAMDTFLFINNFEFDAPEGETAQICLGVLTGEKAINDLVRFIRDNQFIDHFS